jgi:hypothetical protein
MNCLANRVADQRFVLNVDRGWGAIKVCDLGLKLIQENCDPIVRQDGNRFL